MGRPKAFDRDQALQTAMELFWSRGYEATSMTDLRKAMGIGRQSLYDTFGDKDALFAEALDLYARSGAEATGQMLDADDGVAAIRQLVTMTAERLASGGPIPGCMIVNACIERAPHDVASAAQVRSGITSTQEHMEAALRRSQAAGTLRADADPGELAVFLATVLHGLAVRARSGAPAEEIRIAARTALGVLD